MHTHTQPPQAAHVFLDVAQACRAYAPTNLVPIGEVTGALLTKAGGQIAFAPSKALAKVLAVELPPVERKEVGELLVAVGAEKLAGPCTAPSPLLTPRIYIIPCTQGPTRVLYPASKKAQKTLEDGLAARVGADGRPQFEVVRLNTYDTVPAEWGEAETVGGWGFVLYCLVWFGLVLGFKSPGLVFMCFIKPRGHIHTDRPGPARARW